jgi:hypothetical protein
MQTGNKIIKKITHANYALITPTIPIAQYEQTGPCCEIEQIDPPLDIVR